MRSINKIYLIILVVLIVFIVLFTLIRLPVVAKKAITNSSVKQNIQQENIPLYGPIMLKIYNNQIVDIPDNFQQDIAICNGSINIGTMFSHINDPEIFSEIDPNGQNVYFFTNSSNPQNSLLYSWYEGVLSYPSMICYVWWIKLPNGISANSNITIYMYIGNSSNNYYQLYYPYVGANPYVIQGYDNGQQVFTYYWTSKDFNNSSLFGIIGEIYNSNNYVYLNSSKISGIYTLNIYNLSRYIVDFYLSLPGQQKIKFGIGTNLNMSCSTYGIYYCTNLSLYDSLSYIVDGNSLANFLYDANIPTIYSVGYNNYNTFFLDSYYQMISSTILPKLYDNYTIFLLGENVTNLNIYWIRVRILPPFGNMPQIYITGLFK
jgi:hypothetical protein